METIKGRKWRIGDFAGLSEWAAWGVMDGLLGETSKLEDSRNYLEDDVWELAKAAYEWGRVHARNVLKEDMVYLRMSDDFGRWFVKWQAGELDQQGDLKYGDLPRDVDPAKVNVDPAKVMLSSPGTPQE